MHEIDLSQYDFRTDLVIEENLANIKNKSYCKKGIKVDDFILKEDNSLKRKKGKYVTISFDDITDTNNFKDVLKIFKSEFRKMLTYCHIKKDASCLIIGLGNREIISDALGSKVLENITVTRHMYLLGDVDKRYRNIAILEPNVMGVTGIDSYEIIKNVVMEIKPDFILCIDSLCAMNLKRLTKTIQITSSGITPGSGVGNNRHELSLDTLKVPTIAIGVPTVVDVAVIVSDTINYLLKKISYLKENINNPLDKLKPLNKINYLNNDKELTKEERQKVLGYIGLLDDNSLKSLVWEVLSPLNNNMIVTTKEIDFITYRLAELISEGLNKTLNNL